VRQDHLIAVAVGHEHRNLGAAEPLQQHVTWGSLRSGEDDAPGSDEFRAVVVKELGDRAWGRPVICWKVPVV
jgi:hypothetical protein